MYFYFLQSVFFIFSLYMYSKAKESYGALCLKIFSFMIIFLPAALRFNIGTDYQNYVDIFDSILLNENVTTEVGWRLLNKVCIFFHLPKQFLFIISSFIIYILVFKITKKNYIILLITFYLYLYTASFNIIRNCICLAFVLCGYFYISKNENKKGLMYTFFGCLFHNSGYIFLLVYIFSFMIKLNKKKTLFMFFCIYIIFKLVNIKDIFETISVFYGFKWAYYFTSEKYFSTSSVGFGVLLRHFFLIFTYLLCDESKVSKKEFSLMSIMFLCLSISDFLSCQLILFFRLHICFYVSYICMYVVVCKSNKNETNIYKKICRYVILVYAFIFVFIISLLNNENGIIPYQHINLGDLF